MKISNIRQCVLFVFAIMGLCSSCGRGALDLESPDGRVAASLDENGHLHIAMDGKAVMEVSDMGLDISSRPLSASEHDGRGREVVSRTGFDSSFLLPWGENKTLREHYNELVVDCVQMRLRIRLFDDGVAWRYEYDNLKPGVLHGETTRYRWACDGTCWSIPANFESYEFAYRELPLSRTPDANTPATFLLDNGVWCSLHEAALYDMPEMTLVRDTSSSDSLAFNTWLAPSADSALGYGYPLTQTSLVTSWRTLTLGREAVDLINSSLLLSLNAASSHAATLKCADSESQKSNPASYRPIKYIGIWWGMHLGIESWTPDARHGATTENALRYIDFAASHGIDGVLLEGWNRGWEQWGGTQEFDYLHAAPDLDLPKVADHARRRGVELILHHETGGNLPHYEEQMEEAFALCEQLGVHYVKTGYAGGFPNRELHHSRYGVSHYQRAVECAARHHIALNVHEPIKPTGLCRTYPNLMTGEGARGMEWNAWSDGNSPEHTTVLPFTRLLAGPMDYTPGIFDITYRRIQHNPNCRQWNQQDARHCRVHTTLAKQCALWVVLYSPWVMAADLIENYEGHPMFAFFREYDPDCDWSRALAGEPGRYVAIVRHAGAKYFLGAVTNREARQLSLPLDFLPKRKQGYRVTLYEDAPESHYVSNPTAYQIRSLQVQSDDTLRLFLAPGGGCAAVIE